MMLEKFLEQLMRQAGISPQQIVAAYSLVIQWQGEIDAFKQGAAGMVKRFDARIDDLEFEMRGLHHMMVDLHKRLDSFNVPRGEYYPVPETQPSNGAIEHAQRSD